MKWKALAHNGIALAPEYEPRGFHIKIRGKKIALTPEQEEMAVAWAKKKDTPYVKDQIFAKNFLGDFLKLFPTEYKDAKIEEIDFGEINAHIDKEKSVVLDKDAKKKLAEGRKNKREEMKEKYGWAVVDGERFEIANWMVEPPGIFMGRGSHPMRGRWKPRVHQKDITLNIGEDAPVPDGRWGQIVHDHDSMWLARWIDKLSDKEKYVWLSDTATLKQERDQAKYDKANDLSKYIDKVIAKIYEAMESKELRERMIATACFLIYKLAMRVGDEKDPDEADTVGASTLRVEHVKLGENSVEFDFLGKDSVRWQKSVDINGRDHVVHKNIREFTKNKKPSDLIFSEITSRNVNNFFGKIMKGLTAKVFRTYLATDIVTKYLAKADGQLSSGSEYVKIYHARMANLQAAIACNHKRAPPKNFEQSLQKKRDVLETVKAKIRQKAWKTEKQEVRLKERAEKLELQLDLAENTKDYNLNTSLRNYIDPRVYKAWCDHVNLDWTKIYTKTLQRKFMWVTKTTPSWQKMVVVKKVR